MNIKTIGKRALKAIGKTADLPFVAREKVEQALKSTVKTVAKTSVKDFDRGLAGIKSMPGGRALAAVASAIAAPIVLPKKAISLAKKATKGVSKETSSLLDKVKDAVTKVKDRVADQTGEKERARTEPEYNEADGSGGEDPSPSPVTHESSGGSGEGDSGGSGFYAGNWDTINDPKAETKDRVVAGLKVAAAAAGTTAAAATTVFFIVKAVRKLAGK